MIELIRHKKCVVHQSCYVGEALSATLFFKSAFALMHSLIYIV